MRTGSASQTYDWITRLRIEINFFILIVSLLISYSSGRSAAAGGIFETKRDGSTRQR